MAGPSPGPPLFDEPSTGSRASFSSRMTADLGSIESRLERQDTRFMGIQCFSHIGICVSDLSRSERFYAEGLGFTREATLQVEGEPSETLLDLKDVDLRAIYLVRDGVRIELLHYESPGVEEGPRPRPMNQLGLTHLSLRVEDLAGTLTALEAVGAEILRQSQVGVPERGRRSSLRAGSGRTPHRTRGVTRRPDASARRGDSRRDPPTDELILSWLTQRPRNGQGDLEDRTTSCCSYSSQRSRIIRERRVAREVLDRALREFLEFWARHCRLKGLGRFPLRDVDKVELRIWPNGPVQMRRDMAGLLSEIGRGSLPVLQRFLFTTFGESERVNECDCQFASPLRLSKLF